MTPLRNEIWKEIKGYNGIYFISNLGRVKSISRKIPCKDGNLRLTKEKILKHYIGISGYPTVRLSCNGYGRPVSIHRLIGEYFIPNPENKPQINHKNGVRHDYRIENLEWVSCRENVKHSFDVLKRKVSGAATGIKWPEQKKGKNHHRYMAGCPNARKGESHHASKKINCPTLGIDFISIKSTADILGLNTSEVSNVLLGKINHIKGLVFRYI